MPYTRREFGQLALVGVPAAIGLARLPLRAEGFEGSVEVDPRVTTRAHLEAMRALGISRISLGVQDFDAEVLRLVNRPQPFEITAALCAEGKPKRPAPKSKPALDLPDDLGAALKANAAAQGHWDAFSPGKRRDYIEWVLDAKREETRVKRIETTVAQVAEGKERHWKYKGC